MDTPTLTILRDSATQLSTLAGVMQISGREQKAQSIRRAEKSLVALEAFFTPNLNQEIRRWRDARNALKVLNEKLKIIEAQQKQIDASENRIHNAQSSMERWLSLPTPERARFCQESRLAQHFLENEIYLAEAHILHRYQRYSALKVLDPFADNAEHLCEAIYHYENRNKYENNIVKLEHKKEYANERLKSVRRGFTFALGFCSLLVTIPLCAPIAFSLWARRRDIETQIANIEETRRREDRRLQSAEEGVIASETIREILGDIPLEQIRRTLNELRELRAEFIRPDRGGGATTRILTFLELNQTNIQNLFGEMPLEPVDSVAWFFDNVTRAENMEKYINTETERLNTLKQQQRDTTKGYSAPILRKSIESLSEVRDRGFPMPFSEDLKLVFADMCARLLPILDETRKLLWRITHAQMVPDSQWGAVQIRLRSEANTFAACLATLDIEAFWGGEESNQATSEGNTGHTNRSQPEAALA
jgi:hypothetical protein